MKTVGFFGGKFLPWHQGHIYAVMKASNYVEKLYVVLASDEETDRALCEEAGINYIPVLERLSWMGETLADLENIHILSVDDYGWDDGAKKITGIIPEKITHVFSSEITYEEYFNKLYPYAEHIIIDNMRDTVNTSGTEIRSDIFKHWNMIPNCARPYFIKKVAIVGTESCVDSETEYFNGKAWKKINEYQGEQVLQFNNDETASLTIPERYIDLPLTKKDKFYRISNTYQTWEQIYTQDHDLVYKTSKGNLAKKKMQDIYDLHTSNKWGFQGKLLNNFHYSGELNIESSFMRLFIAISADGSLSRSKKWWRVRLLKERKIERLRKIILDCDLILDERVYEDGSHNFFVPFEYGIKQFPYEWYSLNQKSKEIFLEEIFLWDGYFKGKTYFSTIIENAKIVQFILTSLGKKINWYEDIRKDRATTYKITMSSIKYTTISLNKINRNKKDKIISTYTNHDGRKYCFTVPSGMLVLRRNNHIFITGNCGKSTLTKQLAKYYNTTYVHEVGRDYCEKYSDQLTQNHFDSLAMDHYRLQEIKAETANKILFIDSEAVVTQYYAEMYGFKATELIEALVWKQNYDLIIHLEPDVKWVADGFRKMGEQDIRKKNDAILRGMFRQRDIQVSVISGSFVDRFEKAKELVDTLFLLSLK